MNSLDNRVKKVQLGTIEVGKKFKFFDMTYLVVAENLFYNIDAGIMNRHFPPDLEVQPDDTNYSLFKTDELGNVPTSHFVTIDDIIYKIVGSRPEDKIVYCWDGDSIEEFSENIVCDVFGEFKE